MSTHPSLVGTEFRHAALWLIGPDMPGLLNLGSTFVTQHGGNINKDIADKFGEKAVVFLSLTAKPVEIAAMDRDKDELKRTSGCGVVFQPMTEPTVPAKFEEELHGFDIVTDDSPGLLVKITKLVSEYGMMTVGHTGERRVQSKPQTKIQFGQKFVVMLPHDFDRAAFAQALAELVKEYHGIIMKPLRPVPGLLWWW